MRKKIQNAIDDPPPDMTYLTLDSPVDTAEGDADLMVANFDRGICGLIAIR